MKTKLFVGVLVMMCIFIVGCSDNNVLEPRELNVEPIIQEEPVNEEVIDELPIIEEEVKDEVPLEEEEIVEEVSIWVGKYGLEPGNDYVIHGETDLYENADRFIIGPVVHTAKPGQKYVIEEIEGPLVKVSSPDRSGWLSIWYFTDEAKAVEQVEPYEMVVIKPSTFSYYPNEAEPYGLELTTGRVVQVTAKYQDWVSVRVTMHVAEFPGDIWMKAENLIAYDPDFVTEGLLRLGGKVYNLGGQVKEEDSGFPVIIDSEEGDMYRFNAPGGRTGYILKDDFVPNPFVEPVLKMRFAVNFGMDADYLVEELAGNSVTHRYFDYQHSFEPETETNIVAFEDMLKSQNGVREHLLYLSLDYGDVEVDLAPSNDMIELIESSSEFREQLGERLGEPILGIGQDLQITADMIR